MTTSTSPADLHQYSALFYRYQREGSARSAAQVLPILRRGVAVRSVLDVGCGAGAWLSVHSKLGATDLQGVDGDYVDRSLLMFDEAAFKPTDITKSFDFSRTYDLVQCLEVAEHVTPSASNTLVDNIVRHGSHVMFSAAVPGQGGEDHINEQSYGYWRDLFAARGYRLFDFIRPQMVNNEAIEPWYRYNILFFVHDRAIAQLPKEVAATRVPDGAQVADFSPAGYRLRKAVLRQLPVGVVTKLANWKHRRAVRALANT